MQEDITKEDPDFPEDSENVLGGCNTCRAVWRPTRRELVGTAIAATAMTIAGSSSAAVPSIKESNSAVNTIAGPAGPLNPSQCLENFGTCVQDAADNLALCLKDAQDAHDICDSICIANHTGIGRLTCQAGCNINLAAASTACAAVAVAAELACDIAYKLCIEAAIAQEFITTLEEATQWVNDNNISPGTTIVIGGLLLLVIACAIATEGLCLIVLA